MNALAAYLWSVAGLSVVAIGGANAVLPEIHATTVTQHHWLTSQDFAQLFAIAQAAPGPNCLIISLVGWKIGGVPGALASLVALVGPSSLLAYAASRAWVRFEHARWRIVLAAVLSPIAVGFVAGSGVVVASTLAPHALDVALVVTATLVAWRTKVSPLVILAAGAVAGMTGRV